MALTTPQLRVLYRRRARNYDRSIILLRLSGLREKHCRREAVRALGLRPGDTVVDLGCGTGRNLPLLRQAVGPTGRVIGVDLTDAMLAQAERRVRDAGWTNVELIESDAAAFAFPEPTHAVLSTFAITLVPEFDAIIRRAVLALAPEGRVAVLDFKFPERWPMWLVRLAAWANKPYGVTLDLADRRAWESIARYCRARRFEEFYGGAVYLSVGSAPPAVEPSAG